MPCPIGIDGREHLDHAVAVHRDGHALLEHIAAGPFEEGGDAAGRAACRARFDSAARASKPSQSASASAWSITVLELAGVVDLAHRVGVGHLLGPDEVAPAQLDAVDAGLARGLVHQPLDGVDGLGPAGAAVGAGRRGVGQHRA